MKQLFSTIIAIFVTPCVPVIAFGVISTISDRNDGLNIAIGIAPFEYLFSLLMVVLLGLPALLVGKYVNLVRWWACSVVGFALGICAAIVLQWNVLVHRLIDDPKTIFWDVFVFGLVGAGSALVFWSIWKRK